MGVLGKYHEFFGTCVGLWVWCEHARLMGFIQVSRTFGSIYRVRGGVVRGYVKA